MEQNKFSIDDDVLDLIEELMNDLMDEVEKTYSKPIAGELQLSLASICAALACEAGINRSGFIQFMEKIYDAHYKISESEKNGMN